MRNDGGRTRFILGIAFVLRVIFAFRFTYFHPDEHLQGPQEIAHGSFGWASQTPWEFTNDHKVRSFVPLWLVYGIPMSFFGAESDPVHVLYTLRVVVAALTWVLEDMAVERLAPTRNDKLRCLFFVSTSYVTLTWQAHTLSNSLETIFVLWFLVIVHEARNMVSAAFQSPFDRHYDSFLLGLLVTMGVFNRPTFLAFIFVPALYLPKFWLKFKATFLTFIFAVGLGCFLCVKIDTLLYGSQELVIAPLNFIRYNSNLTNLDDHGIHSYYTHLVASIPQLIGPGIFLLHPQINSLSFRTVLGALTVLSLIPHQEARFLLPLVPLLCMQMHSHHIKPKWLRHTALAIWLGFNLLLGLGMGLFHQGGVLPAQVEVRNYTKPSTIIWWGTYTPPLWVTGLQSSEVNYAELGIYGLNLLEMKHFVAHPAPEKLTVIDLLGAKPEIVSEILDSAQRDNLYLVKPNNRKLPPDSLTLNPAIWQTRMHWDPMNFDIFGSWSDQIGLKIFNLSSDPLSASHTHSQFNLSGQAQITETSQRSQNATSQPVNTPEFATQNGTEIRPKADL